MILQSVSHVRECLDWFSSLRCRGLANRASLSCNLVVFRKKCSHLDTVTNVLTSCDLSANNLSESFTILDPRTRGIRGPVDTCGTVRNQFPTSLQFPGFQYLPKNAKTSKLCPAHHSRTTKRAITTVGNQAQDPTDEDEDDMWQMRQNKIYTHTRAIPNSRISPQRRERRAFSRICSETFQSGR